MTRKNYALKFLVLLAVLSVQLHLGAACITDQVLLLNVPDPTLAQYVGQAIFKFNLLGYNIAIDPSGVPVTIEPVIPGGGQAYTGYRHLCFYGHCNSSNSYIKVSPDMMTHPSGFILVSVEHEISHLISGFGSCVTPEMNLPMKDAMHLVAGNLISNGNTNYATFSFTEKDLILLHSCL